MIRRRFRPLVAAAGFYLAACLVLRVTLLIVYGGRVQASHLQVLEAFWIGFRMDLAAGVWLLFPLAVWITFLPDLWFRSRFHQIFLNVLLAALAGLEIFLVVTEFEFFDEFNARFNTVAVDYLIYPQEVFVNIWESYPVVKIVSACALGAAIVWFLISRYHREIWRTPVAFGRRSKALGLYLVLAIVANTTVRYATTRFTTDRVLNEVSSDGAYSFAYSAVTRDLEYPAFYKTLPREEAYARTRALLSQPNAIFEPDPESITRTINPTLGPRAKNLVIILVESFGSEFWGALGRPDSLTPEMDALAKEGILFTNLYACGNRTVRGMEGSLSSFPPLPSDSIVKRNRSNDVATVARTLKDKAFDTLFLYGGRGLFDGMRSYAIRNGYDRFIEQKDFAHPTFTTIWGVCDEDMFDRAVVELRALQATGKPFFVTALTVSNHKPYTYPPGRIPEDPNARNRGNAVKYTDYAIGRFIRMVKKEPLYKDTVFAIMADHGARVYGRQTIPIPSYRIPLLLVGGPITKPARIDTLGGTLDVGPTMLAFLGIPYRSVFFGRDLLNEKVKTRWAVMNHNRDVGLFIDNKLSVLGLNKTSERYVLDPKNDNLTEVVDSSKAFDDLEKNTIALYQVADDLYTNERFRTDK